jgi:hypothetical protein
MSDLFQFRGRGDELHHSDGSSKPRDDRGDREIEAARAAHAADRAQAQAAHEARVVWQAFDEGTLNPIERDIYAKLNNLNERLGRLGAGPRS